MSLLTAAKQKNPDLGYAPDFVAHAVGPHLKDIQRKGVKIIANAGGINTSACVAALTTACQKAGVEGMKIAQVRLTKNEEEPSSLKSTIFFNVKGHRRRSNEHGRIES